ncbi:peptidyl-tRNA hydrolase-like isoform X2 [Bolinopsis microptera]|uniref:peptidyl-tRNA hydrolase-like isoform X2 n=1 Tax=Bolinopsis microptera TaxID=2820187 RepID=UPI0030790B00
MSIRSRAGTLNLRGSLRRLFSLTSSETSNTLVKSEPPPSPNNRILIVGLGNYPAPRSRHSVGQYLLRGIAERNSVEFSYKRSCKAHLASFQYNDAEVFLLKPKHFMNLNGKSVVKAASVLQISPTHVVLLHDELDLPLGKFKVKHGGSANGHNGVIDSQERMKYNDIKRLRIGIGRPDNKEDVMDYVLEDFTRNERNQLSAMKETMIDTVHQIIAVMLSPPDENKPKVNQPKKKKKPRPAKPETAAITADSACTTDTTNVTVEGSIAETAEPCSVVNEQDEISAVEIVAEDDEISAVEIVAEDDAVVPETTSKTPQPDSPVN